MILIMKNEYINANEKKTRKVLALSEPDIEIWRAGENSLPEFSHTAARIYKNEYAKRGEKVPDSDAEDIAEEDRRMFARGAVFFVIRPANRKQILGTIRVIRKKKNLELPIEKEFGVDLAHLPAREIWHAGRLTVDKRVLKLNQMRRSDSFRVFQVLLALSFYPVYHAPSSILVAENDEILMRMFKTLLGLTWSHCGRPRQYLGSATHPAYITNQELNSCSWLRQLNIKVEDSLPRERRINPETDSGTNLRRVFRRLTRGNGSREPQFHKELALAP